MVQNETPSKRSVNSANSSSLNIDSFVILYGGSCFRNKRQISVLVDSDEELAFHTEANK